MTPDQIKKKVVSLWNEGVSSGAIADQLSLSRSAVMGIVHRAKRMGKIKRPPRQKPAVVAVKVQNATPAPSPRTKPTLAFVSIQRDPEMPKKPPAPPPPQLPLHQPKTINQLGPFDCRWIRPDKKYCGHPAKSARTPWCEEHYRIVYVPGSARRGA